MTPLSRKVFSGLLKIQSNVSCCKHFYHSMSCHFESRFGCFLHFLPALILKERFSWIYKIRRNWSVKLIWDLEKKKNILGLILPFNFSLLETGAQIVMDRQHIFPYYSVNLSKLKNVTGSLYPKRLLEKLYLRGPV